MLIAAHMHALPYVCIGNNCIDNILHTIIVNVVAYDPDSQFTMSALSRLNDVGIPVLTFLNTKIQLLQQILSAPVPDAYIYTQSASLLNAWLSSGMLSRLPSSWRNLLLIIRLLNLDELAQRMETYLSTGVIIPIKAREGGTYQLKRGSQFVYDHINFVENDIDEQLRLREDTIFHLKQEISTLQQRIDELNSANKRLQFAESLHGKGTIITQCMS